MKPDEKPTEADLIEDQKEITRLNIVIDKLRKKGKMHFALFKKDIESKHNQLLKFYNWAKQTKKENVTLKTRVEEHKKVIETLSQWWG